MLVASPGPKHPSQSTKKKGRQDILRPNHEVDKKTKSESGTQTHWLTLSCSASYSLLGQGALLSGKMAVGAITCSWLSGVTSIDVARSSLSSYCLFSTPQHGVRALISKNGDGVPKRASNFSSSGKGTREVQP